MDTDCDGLVMLHNDVKRVRFAMVADYLGKMLAVYQLVDDEEEAPARTMDLLDFNRACTAAREAMPSAEPTPDEEAAQ